MIRNTADVIHYFPKQRVLDGLKLGSGFLLIVVNCLLPCLPRRYVCRLYEMSTQPHLFRLMFTFS